ncbi:hypothetical protein ERICIV_03594 [Paenibacillus larvae subsp. larvae]|uniref:DUF4355 domain-containing protein n=1 Tax=Paenibacillus larvae subsp. larvae TaxID=147375 RepID=A0A2L1UHY0_9BACL|nr:DUF4355 domain-containing protein [Paenibacillus larvae]AQT84297.1 hypothetical protein B1222_07620 [Paenibacillus larvae subsp. pulvifaciens]AQZ46279.1 hypothetical protein B5S25_06205 [Paenibacillus larvae subsp. pulvifaciens]AVF27956.1 hypothetical protein ERICIII_03852 [Paenibacillus larvae subsp. larvae]AVF32458.1 hypothetical protein ERICIV_03594 [Paenibacillus larvae subsp. larvae]MBH0344152.1 hypothetical protein [Paenibacillus larvae]
MENEENQENIEQNTEATKETKEQTKEKTEEKGKVTFTPEQQAVIEEMFSARFSREKKKSEAEKEEAAKLAEMNAQQKAEYERDQLQKQLDELLKKDRWNEMSKEANKMLKESGIASDDQVLGFVVQDTAEATQEAVKAFVDLVNTKAEEITRQKLSGTAPRVQTSPASNMTKESIMQIKDAAKRQKAMAENIHLFQ